LKGDEEENFVLLIHAFDEAVDVAIVMFVLVVVPYFEKCGGCFCSK
jgi:hypothetical protein